MPIVKKDVPDLNQRTTILLAEDNDDDVVLIRAALEQGQVPYRLEAVEHGQQAIDYLQGKGPYSNRKLHPMPFLLLLDLKMPVLDGFEVLRWVRSRPALDKLLVVILTASDISADVSKADHLGTNSYLVKSSDYHQLVLLLQSFEASPVSPGGKHLR